MANLPSTVLGTSDPVDLCKGFALFPALGTIRAGIQTGNSTKSLFNVSPQVLMWRFNANASYGIFMGICGPAYGFRYEAQGSTDNGTLTMNVSDDIAAGGILMGLNLDFQATISVQRLSFEWVWDGWNSHITTSWENAFNVTPEIQVDFIGLILAIILYINDQQEGSSKNQLMSKVGSFAPGLLGSWGFYDQQADQLGDGDGSMTFEPALLIPINLANLVPQLAEINKGLAVIWGGFGVGPQFGISIPTTATVTGFSVDSSQYTNLQWDGGTATGTGGTEIASPKTLGCSIQHRPGMDFQFGVWAQVYALKLFEIGFSEAVDMLQLLGIEPKFGPYDNSVSSPIGGGPNSAVVGARAFLEESDALEVILAPPAVPA
ncbi:hypothetical protein EON79_09075 [bacterium]|nr:MAG: hypothetical protein EON79_09075 [bacterium]